MRAARSRAVRSFTERGSTETPHDGMVSPGKVPPPATASVSTTFVPGASAEMTSARTRNASTGSHAMRQNGIAVASPSRYACATAWSPARVSLSARSARASGCAFNRSMSVRRPTMIPACGPPRSLSPEKVTSAAPASMHWRTPSSSRSQDGRSRSHGVVSSSSPEPASTMTGSSKPASSATGVDETKPIMR